MAGWGNGVIGGGVEVMAIGKVGMGMVLVHGGEVWGLFVMW